MATRTRRRTRRRYPHGAKFARLTARQQAGLRKGWKLAKRSRRNPGTAAGARKARRRKAIKNMARRRSSARVYRRKLPGYKVVVRRRAGKRKMNTKWGRKKGIRTGRRGTISFRKPVGRGRFRRVATNPALSAKTWLSGITELPNNVTGIFKGRDMLPNIGFAVGGAIGGTMVGGLVRGTIMSALPVGLAGNRIVQGVLGAAITYSGGYAVGQLLIKDNRRRTAFITGAAAAAIVNALMPGQVNRLLTSIPVIGPQLARLPGMNGLGAYVSAPGYQAVGSYVSAPGYQAVGAYDDAIAGVGYSDDALAGELGAYVSAPSYQAVGDLGMYGSSHLD